MSDDLEDKKRFNWNWIALGILIIAYIFSAGRFLILSAKNESNDDQKIIRVAHWQLEPGYREAIDWAIAEYEQLPHVKEAGIKVEQIPLPTRVYNQFMNVHLISGTAPDIAAAGFNTLIQGNAIARFYASLGDYVNEPNPYNSDQYLAQNLDPELRNYLISSPWQETFMDGMEGGWKPELNDYYSVPISNLGGMRFFYNMDIVLRAKDFVKKAADQEPQPAWLQKMWLRDIDGEVTGYLPDNQRLRDWLDNKQPPETLGQFILLCYGIQAMAKAENIEHLVPVSVGKDGSSDPMQRYAPGFYRLMNENLDQDGADGLSGLEIIDGLVRGDWDFKDKPSQEMVKLAKTFVQFYPAGYQGLDREQTQRRFVSGDAAIFGSGSWDAAGVFKGVQEADDPADRFEVMIAPPPMPASDERWGGMLTYPVSEANFRTGVPLAINKQSENFDWALDFLMFLSSQPVNEEFNKIAAWLPAIVGSETTESMRPFEPIVEGYPGTESFSPGDNRVRSNIRNQWSKDFNQVVISAMDYDQFAVNMHEYLKGNYQGIRGYWYQSRLDSRDKTRSLDRTLSVEEFNQATHDDEKSASRFRSLFYQSLIEDEGINLELMWWRLYPNEPYPNLD